MKQSDVERFRSKVAAEPDEDGCVMYLGGWSASGYGIFWLAGKQVPAHRVAWTLQNGPIPDGLHALHRCDNRYCINVDHLFLGTAQDNVNDMRAKGRDSYGDNFGERNGQATLTEAEVAQIKFLVLEGHLTQQEIGEMYGTSRENVSGIKRCLRWSHVEPIAPPMPTPPEGRNEMTELEELKKRVEELENAAKPAEPFVPGPRFQFDPTANASMPPSALREMVNAVPESLMRDLRADAQKPNPVTGGPNPQPLPQVQRGSGWVEPRPLESPPGLKYVDAQIDAQDAKDRAELALKFAKAELGKAE